VAHKDFYRVKAAALAWRVAQEQCGRQLQQAQKAMQDELIACGLDPSVEYSLDEARREIVKVESTPSDESTAEKPSKSSPSRKR
jgi:hypothetical protein